ncbi:hypothetical protein VDGL01_00118 [Verticillium dahliae]
MPRHSSDPGAPATPGTWRQSMVHGSPQCIKPKVEVLGTKEYLGYRLGSSVIPIGTSPHRLANGSWTNWTTHALAPLRTCFHSRHFPACGPALPFCPPGDDSTPLQGVPILSRSSWQNFFQPKKPTQRTTVHICSGFV